MSPLGRTASVEGFIDTQINETRTCCHLFIILYTLLHVYNGLNFVGLSIIHGETALSNLFILSPFVCLLTTVHLISRAQPCLIIPPECARAIMTEKGNWATAVL